MMEVHSRVASGTEELSRILEFAHHYPENCFHVVDLPYRLCSPAAQDMQNIQLWEDQAGKLVAFAVIQLPFSTIDWAVQPDFNHLKAQVLQWAVQRLETIAGLRGESFGFLWDSWVKDDPAAPSYGFQLDDWWMRHMMLTPDRSVPSPALPAGFRIRPLNGGAVVADYVALHRVAFGTRNMSEDWRARTLAHPLYQADLDLVAVNEEGRLVAFCIGWMCRLQGEWVGQIEPLGVLPEFQRQGLGRSILLETLRRMAEREATSILIEAESYNPASQTLYEEVGFRDISHTLKYFRRF